MPAADLKVPLVPSGEESEFADEDEDVAEEVARQLNKPVKTRSVSNFCAKLPQKSEKLDTIKAGVWCVVIGQFCFYGVSMMFLPALYKHTKTQGWTNPAKVFANALVAAGSITLASSFVLGQFSDTYGEKRAYQVALLLAIISDLMISLTTDPMVFVVAWALLKAASEGLRGAKNAYLCKHSGNRFNYVSNLALNAGIIGSTVVPLVGAFLLHQLGDAAGFVMLGLTGAALHGILFAAICLKMEVQEDVVSTVLVGQLKFRPKCVECRKVLTEEENNVYSKLCKEHFDHFENLYRMDATGCSYSTFRNAVLAQMCISVVLFQFSINCTVMALFQPLVVNQFQWTSEGIAYVQSFMSLLGFFISSFFAGLSKSRAITADQQNRVGQLCFLVAVALFVVPPLSEYRLVAANIFSFFGQIIFSGPMHVLFGQIMSSDHITSIQLSILGAQIAMGQAIGCYAAPFLLPYAGQGVFSMPLIPAVLGVLSMSHLVWKYDPNGREAAMKMKKDHRAAIRQRLSKGLKAVLAARCFIPKTPSQTPSRA